MFRLEAEFSAILSNCVLKGDQAEIRLIPFEMSNDEAPVLSLMICEPNFDGGAVRRYLEHEVEVEVFDKHVRVNIVGEGVNLVLGGDRLKASQTAYDTDDLRFYVHNLTNKVAYYSHRMNAAIAKDARGRSILQELIRRAEIKAAASDHHRDRQAAALEVMRRLQAHFGDGAWV